MKKLVEILREHDLDTYHHSIRVADLSLAIAKTMNFSDEEHEIIYYGGLLHDIGKVKISKDVLTKPGKLTVDEWDLIQKHPIYGFEILNNHLSIHMEIKYIVLFHHERINGSGYPFGLSVEKINLKSQIIAVADSFDAMTNHRKYSRAKSIQSAVEEIMSDKGKLFSPVVVDKLAEVLTNEVREVLFPE